MQNDGRKNQLGIGFGNVDDDSAHPDCRGITKEELSRLDFSKMDFSSLYEEIRKNAASHLPTNETLKQKSTGYTYEQLKEKNAQGKVISTPGFSTEQKAADRLNDFYARIKK